MNIYAPLLGTEENQKVLEEVSKQVLGSLFSTRGRNRSLRKTQESPGLGQGTLEITEESYVP